MPWPPTESQWQAYLERERAERRARHRHDWLEAGQLLLTIIAIFAFLGGLTYVNDSAAVVLLLACIVMLGAYFLYR
jgi:hypothetical protein